MNIFKTTLATAFACIAFQSAASDDVLLNVFPAPNDVFEQGQDLQFTFNELEAAGFIQQECILNTINYVMEPDSDSYLSHQARCTFTRPHGNWSLITDYARVTGDVLYLRNMNMYSGGRTIVEYSTVY
ncbi:hypothetical protein [Algicola sagamiensis]|uniref:hypothetical protein n=1 Tax=Algicola sagamiensis TaxID=163869 RepID=UPI00035E79FA|nr:hypothetical protein [Algicola sagamiensis]